MSLGAFFHVLYVPCRPRVSGDEPWTILKNKGMEASTPRERG